MATRTYGIFWRWHFLAGMIACPIIFVVAITGAIYTFQPEIERALNGSLVEVTPEGPRRSLDELQRALPADCAPARFNVQRAADRAVVVGCADGRAFTVDPYRATLLGAITPNPFFHVVFDLHWELLLGEPGRLVIEWATSWTVMLMLSGAYLWWPRGKTGGAWWLRRGPRIAPRQRLRDLHAVFGAYAIPCLLVLATTGLFWTVWAGEERWHRLQHNVVTEAMETAPTSTPTPGAPRLTAQQALDASGLYDGTRAVAMNMPRKPEAPFLLFGYDDDFARPSTQAMVYVDAYSGARLRELYWKDLGPLAKVDRAGYSIHVGAILGWPGRIAACLAALILAALAITGPWMWWKRRPRRKLGVPPRAERVPRPLLVVIAALGWLLPAVGWTLIAVLGYELLRWLWQYLRHRRRPIIG